VSVAWAGRIDDDVGYECAVDEGLDAEVEVRLRPGYRGAQVDIGVADVDDGGVVTGDLDDGRPAGGRGGGAILRHGSVGDISSIRRRARTLAPTCLSVGCTPSFGIMFSASLLLIFDPLRWRNGVHKNSFACPPVMLRGAMRAFCARQDLGQPLNGIALGLNASRKGLARPRTLKK
jgi:hypothetical protein